VLPFHRAVLNDDDFVNGMTLKVHTQWIETTFAERLPADALLPETDEPGVTTSWIEIDGRRHTLRMPASSTPFATTAGAHQAQTSVADPGAADSTPGILAPMAGTLSSWMVDDGSTVAVGDSIAVMEAMKMETTVTATSAGILHHRSAPGDFVSAGDQLATIEGP
jgi:acetyl-CoA/propionyl-CoA carboxylase biotin carboxyl carrier protein